MDQLPRSDHRRAVTLKWPPRSINNGAMMAPLSRWLDTSNHFRPKKKRHEQSFPLSFFVYFLICNFILNLLSLLCLITLCSNFQLLLQNLNPVLLNKSQAPVTYESSSTNFWVDWLVWTRVPFTSWPTGHFSLPGHDRPSNWSFNPSSTVVWFTLNQWPPKRLKPIQSKQIGLTCSVLFLNPITI